MLMFISVSLFSVVPHLVYNWPDRALGQPSQQSAPLNGLPTQASLTHFVISHCFERQRCAGPLGKRPDAGFCKPIPHMRECADVLWSASVSRLETAVR